MSREGRRDRASAHGWTVPDRVPEPGDVDRRLLDGRGRTARLQVLIDHDDPLAGPCPGCGWVTTASRRDCPSRVIAKALLDRTTLPGWVAHLAGDVPGTRTREAAVAADERRAAEDELPGLFAAPRRTPPGGSPR